MSGGQIPKIEPACNELTLLKNKESVNAYLKEVEIRKAIKKEMSSPEKWHELYNLLAPHCCATVQKLIEEDKYNLPTDRKEELLNGASYNISDEVVNNIWNAITDDRIVEGFALSIISSKLHLTILTNPISRIVNHGSKREKKN